MKTVRFLPLRVPLLLALAAPLAGLAFRFETAIPGGNARLVEQHAETLLIEPERRTSEGDWFYWRFRIQGAQGQTLRLRFTRPVVGVRGPCVGTNGRWRWLGRNFTPGGFDYTFAPGESCVDFAQAWPYLPDDWERFLTTLPNQSAFRRETLCTTPKGRALPLLRTVPARQSPSAQGATPSNYILLTARHHAQESSANFVLEGAVEYLLAHPRAALLAVPFIDLDGALDGEPGKNRRPRDHNRDYDSNPIHPEVRAIQRLLRQIPPSARIWILDLHAPWIRGGCNELVHQVHKPFHQTLRHRLAQLIPQPNPFAYTPVDDVLWGSGWNTPANYTAGTPFIVWAATNLPNCVLATTFEIPFAQAKGIEVTPDAARAFGRALAEGLLKTLSEAAVEAK